VASGACVHDPVLPDPLQVSALAPAATRPSPSLSAAGLL
jgi:hypothetical protein